MGLRGKIHHRVKLPGAEQLLHQLPVTDIALHKVVTGVLFHRRQILQIAGIGQRIQIHKLDITAFPQDVLNKIGADKPGAAGHKYIFHLTSSSATRSMYWP